MNHQKYKGKRVMIVGAQKSGLSLAKYFFKEGAKITISDKKTREELGSRADLFEEFNPTWDLGGHSAKAMAQEDLIILSPGVNPHDKQFEPARAKGTPITGELEFASTLVREPIIAITGTNGKSTVTKLTHLFLEESGVKVWIGGNYGAPLMDYVVNSAEKKEKADVLVVEVSSFQLETCETFKPHVGVLLNLAEDHLDRHKSFADYVNAKKKLFKNSVPEMISVLNADDALVVESARDPNLQRSKLQYFSRKPGFEHQIAQIGGAVYNQAAHSITAYFDGKKETYNTRYVKMKGKHAIENIMAALIAARSMGAKPEAIQKVMNEFPGLEHRLEFVRRKGNVDFYNDSKATNVHSVLKALESFDNQPIILIAGGKDKGVDFSPLMEPVKKKVKNLILIGEAKERLNRTIGDYSETFIIGTFEEAILVAYQKSRNGDVILLSPGCSSYDMFENFEERGNYFKELINKI